MFYISLYSLCEDETIMNHIYKYKYIKLNLLNWISVERRDPEEHEQYATIVRANIYYCNSNDN